MIRSAVVIISMLLMGCAKNNPSIWRLTNAGLFYQNEAVEFNQESLSVCSNCKVVSVTQYSPLGPTKQNQLYHKNELIAVFIDSKNNTLWLPNNADRTIFKIEKKNDGWQLKIDSKLYTLTEKQVLNIVVGNQVFVLLPLKLDSSKLTYIWLKQ